MMNRYRIRKLKEIMGCAPTWDTGQEMLFQVVQILRVEAKTFTKLAHEADYHGRHGSIYERTSTEFTMLANEFRNIIAADCGRCGGVGELGDCRPCPRCQT